MAPPTAPARPTAGLFPPFRPHPLLKSGHAQTLAANYLHGAPRVRTAEATHHVPLDDGDHVVLHDDRPAGWRPGDPAALLLHGLAGCHRSAYLVRAARKLNARGARVFRMDYRSSGAGRALARRPYHAGLSDDAAASLRFIARLSPGSPLGLVGYSMGGNVALKALGEFPDALPDTLVRAAAVNPAVDLAVCCAYLTGPMQRLYDRHFAKALTRHVSRHDAFAEFGRELLAPPVTRIREFDERFTVPRWGFGSVEEYYRTASAARFVKHIRVPTLILHSRDDPLVPGDLFETLDRSDAVTLHLTDHGGHLGFIGVRGVDPDRRWMDWRVVDWLTGRVGPADVPPSSPGRPWPLLIPGRTKATAGAAQLASR
ncbi:MAG TPA: alpha/beta fold hydrolase [Planctomycetaceae bacterium]